jgi:hypothetical protein
MVTPMVTSTMGVTVTFMALNVAMGDDQMPTMRDLFAMNAFMVAAP